MLSRALMFLALGLTCSCSKEEAPRAEIKAPAANTARDPVANEPAVVFLGDSLTAGRGLSEEQAVPALIQSKIKAAGLAYRVINAGRSGDTTAGGLSRLDWYLRDSVAAKVLVIGLGSNDAMRGIELSAIEANLRRIIEQARQQRPGVKLLLWELRTFPNMGVDFGEGYNALFQKIAEDEHVVLIPFPLAGVAGVPQLNTDDGIHPNAEGSRIVADNIWKSLKHEL